MVELFWRSLNINQIVFVPVFFGKRLSPYQSTFLAVVGAARQRHGKVDHRAVLRVKECVAQDEFFVF